MVNQYTMRERPTKERLTELYNSGLTQSELGEMFGCRGGTISKWFKAMGIQARVPKNTNQDGEDNASWKGDDAGVPALHKRLKKLKGSAYKCDECGRDDDAGTYDWANLTGNYIDMDDYMMMCRSCHSKYDKKINNITGANNDN